MSVILESPHASLVFGSTLDTLSPPPTPIAKRARHFFPSNASTPTPMFFPKSQSLLSGRSSSSTSSGRGASFGTLSSHSARPAASTSPLEKEKALRVALARLASRPAPHLTLQPRPANHHARLLRINPKSSFRPGADCEVEYLSSREIFPRGYVRGKVEADEIPPLPFVFDEEEVVVPPSTSKKAVQPAAMSSIPKLPSLSDSTNSNITKSLPIMTAKLSLEPAPQGQVKLPSFARGGIHRRTVKKRNSIVARTA